MMDWNAKWDWENFALFGSKVTEIPKKLPFADFFIGDDGELDTGSFNQSTGGGGNSGASGSDGWHASSAKSSISASTESSTKDALHTPPSFRLMTAEDASKNISMVMDNADVYGTSPPPEASVGSLEPLIGLKLGKRTYFENNVAVGSVKTSSAFPVKASGTSSNKSKLLDHVRPTARCVVEGCNLDLSTAKDYHRKHRVCDSHSKCSKVVVGGFERRFCQQCSRFHNLAEFDDKKRSCRRRLLDHNARRRKPQPENLTSLSSSLYGRRETSFLFNNAPHFFSRNYPSTTWDSTCNSIPAVKLSNVTNLHSNTPSGLFASKNNTQMLDVPNPNPNPGSKVSWASSHLDTAPEYGRALSLLSANSWGSCGPESTTQYYSLHDNFHTVNQPIMHAIPEGLPLSSPELLLPIHQSGSVQPRDGQAIQFYRTAYESDFYSNHPV